MLRDLMVMGYEYDLRKSPALFEKINRYGH